MATFSIQPTRVYNREAAFVGPTMPANSANRPGPVYSAHPSLRIPVIANRFCNQFVSRGMWAVLAAAMGCQQEGPAPAGRPTVSTPPVTSPVLNAAQVESDEIVAAAPEARLAANTSPAATQTLSPQQHFDLGVEHEEAGNKSAAIAHFTAALEMDPEFAAARRQLGALLLEMERYIDASVLFGHLVEREPDNPDAHNDWGVVLVRIGNLQEAIAQFREALRLKSDHPDAHYNLAVALLTDGKVSEAIEHLVEALRILPSYTDAYFTLGRAYLQQGKLEEAVAQLEHVASFDREYKGLDDQLGRAYARQGEVKKAVRHFTLAVRHDPLRFESRYALGTSLAKYGNHPAAAAQFTEAVRIEPESPDAHLQLAQTQARMGQVEKAITHFEAALSLRPEWPEALNNLAWLLATSPDPKLRDPQRALDLAQQAKALADYKMPLVLDTLAAAQASVGDFDQAEQNATQAAQMATDTEQPRLVEEIQRRLESYRNGQPHVENADDNRQSAAE